MRKFIMALLVCAPAVSVAVTTTTYGTSMSGVPNIPSDIPGMNYVNPQDFSTMGGSGGQELPKQPTKLDNLMALGAPSGKPAPKKASDGKENKQQGTALDNLLNVDGGSSANNNSEPNPPLLMQSEDVEEIMRVDSINAYQGECPCPYSINRDGFQCGIESAYYRPGGYRLYCYPEEDLREQQLIFYRKTH